MGHRGALRLVRSLEGVAVRHLMSSFFVPVVGGGGRIEAGLRHTAGGGAWVGVESRYFEAWVGCYERFFDQEARGEVSPCKVYGTSRCVKVAIYYPEERPFHSFPAMAYFDAFQEAGFDPEYLYFSCGKHFFVFVLVV